jgi:transposase
MSRYSLDFRKKIVETYEQGGTSIRKVAQRFQVSPDTVRRLLKQKRETGDLSPRKCGTKRKSILSQHEKAVLEIVEAQPDLTLWQYCEVIREKLDINVNTSMMDRFLKEQEITLKKNIQASKSGHRRSPTTASRLLGRAQRDRPRKTGIH